MHVMRWFEFLMRPHNRTRTLFSECWGPGGISARPFVHHRININRDLQISMVLLNLQQQEHQWEMLLKQDIITREHLLLLTELNPVEVPMFHRWAYL
jgi:hypothetical protein